VSIKIGKISKNGELRIDFNQPLTLPPFIQILQTTNKKKRVLNESSANASRRKLLSIEEIDPLEFLDIEMIKKDDASPSES